MLNQIDQIIFSRRHQSSVSKSIIDLTFSNQENVQNWAIDSEAATGSDHEIIKFKIIAAENNTINSLSTAVKYNVKKADWQEFSQYLKNKEIESMQIMQAKLEKQKFNQAAEVFQGLIQIACDYTIPKLKITAMSKSW